jgi:hypothetical protein
MVKTALALLAISGLSVATVAAQDAPVLGRSHITAELDVMTIQHETFDTDDAGLYVGLAAYFHLKNDWYLGGEIGAGASLGIFNETGYIPLEVNAKRAFALSPHWAVDVGGGLSACKVTFEDEYWFSPDVTVEEWVPGVQVLSDFFFHSGGFLAGLKLKYQLTGDVDEIAELTDAEDGWDFSNLKIGFEIGVRLP